MIVPIAELDATKADIAGGKGAMLGELSRQASMLSTATSVPEGFVVTADAFADWVASSGMTDDNFAKGLEFVGKDVKKLEEMAVTIRDKLFNTPFPSGLEAQVNKALSSKGEWAVRSSGIGEDAGDASFAGQHDSFLNVNKANVLRDIRRVWLSAFNTRALYYRITKDMIGVPLRQAVVVQEMVQPEIAGVAFSADPRTGALDRGLIEYVQGLADRLVSGEVTPVQVPFQHGNEANMEAYHPAILAVAKTVTELQHILGWPCDMEWAWKDKLFLLQARPITSLPKALPEDQIKMIDLVHPEWGKPTLVGNPFSAGEITSFGFITREEAKKAMDISQDKDTNQFYWLPTRIFVTDFTTPDDLPIMEQVRGMIVHEGGVTSHAAIVSREMHKPCIRVDKAEFKKAYSWDGKFKIIPVAMDGGKGVLYNLPDGLSVKLPE